MNMVRAGRHWVSSTAPPVAVEVGKHYRNRAGAVMYVVRRESYVTPSGYVAPNKIPDWFLCEIVRTARGDLPECKLTYGVFPNGMYGGKDPHELDLVEVVGVPE